MTIKTAKKGDLTEKEKISSGTFNFAADRISFRVISDKDCDMKEFKRFVKVFKKQFKKFDVKLSEETKTHKWFAFDIESETYIKFSELREIIDLLENTVVINDDKAVETLEIFF